jgi:hypothetical protein
MVIRPFIKPDGWEELPMFQKIQIYGDTLGEDHAQFVDKLKAKTIVKDLCGDRIGVAGVVRVLKSPYDVQPEDLDCAHMIKSAHGSGWNIDITADLTVEFVKKKLVSWNIKYNTNRERQYSFIEPKFFIEEKIVDSVIGATGNALVYMVRCVNSNPISIGVKYKRVQNSYDTDWNLVGNARVPFEIPKPKRLEEMLEVASKLASQFEFVRVDFYVGENDVLYFSEFTFTPAGGCRVYDMEEEIRQGLLWRAREVD